MSVESMSTWPYPPVRGWMADDLDHISAEGPYGELDLLKHVELIDGALIIMSPQTAWHRAMIKHLSRSLEEQAPSDLTSTFEMDVKLGPRQRPIPDVLVITADSANDLARTYYNPNEVRLAIEVVSEESQVRDRERKPQLYAKAGIPFFWRVENVDGRPVVYTFELDPATQGYSPTGIFHEKLTTNTPFPVSIDLTRIR